MAKIKFEDGTIVNFNGDPTSQDVEEVANRLGLQKSTTGTEETPIKQEGFWKWLGKDILGVQRETQQGIIRPLVQEIIGSKGLAGVFQLPGRIPETYIASKVSEKLSGAQKELYDSATRLLEQRKKFSSDSAEYKNLTQWAQETIQRAGIVGEPLAELQKKITTPSEAVATTIRGAATVGSAALKAPVTIGQAALQGAGFGAAYGGARAIEQGQKPLNIAEDVAISGAIGAGTGALTYLAQKGLQKIGETLYRGLMKYSNSPKVATQEMIDREIAGTSKQILDKINPDIDKYESMLQTELKDSTIRVTKQDVANAYFNRVKEYLTKTGKEDLISTIDAEDIIKNIDKAWEVGNFEYKIPEEGVTLSQLNNITRGIQKKISSGTWKSLAYQSPQISESQSTLLNWVGAARDLIRDKVPNTAPIFEDYAPVLAIKQGINNLIWKVDNKQSVTVTDILAGGLAAFTPVTAPEAITYMAGRRLAQGALVPSVIAKTSLQLAHAIQKASLPEAQALIQNLLSQMVVPTKE